MLDDDATHVPHRLYVWRLLALDPDTARSALRRALRLGGAAGTSPGPWVVPAELWLGRWRRVPIDFELTPWCASRTMLAVRPRLRAPRAPWSRRLYLRTASPLLDRLQAEMEIWALTAQSVTSASRCPTCPMPARCQPGVPVEPLEAVGT
jgi:hypothetical protein